jgi:excisionase family DNA binding protein
MVDDDPETPDDPWLTLAEIAEELRMSPATIRSWISKGTLRAMRPGKRKLLVRRSELDRMLRGEDFEDAPSPPPDPSTPGRRRRQRRFPDTITPPIARPGQPEEEGVDPEEWLGIVQWEWLSALRQSEMAPPDAWFPGRLQLIAEAAARKAAALALFPADEVMRWEGEPDGVGLTLSYELRAGGYRPGSPELWTEFDSAVGRLGIAMQTGEAGLIRGSLEELSVTLHDIADSLERYRGRYGNWTERPTQRPAKDADGRADPGSAATEQSVS